MSPVAFVLDLLLRAGENHGPVFSEPFENAFLWPVFSQSTYSHVSGSWQFKLCAEVGAKLSPEADPNVPRRQNLRQISVGTLVNNKRDGYEFPAL